MSKTNGHKNCSRRNCSLCNRKELNKFKKIRSTGEKKR